MRASGPTATFDGLLAEAGRLLSASLELDETLRTITRLAIPDLADWCALDVVQADGSVHQLSSGHDDPRKDALLLELRRRHRLLATGPEPPPGGLEVLAAGEPRTYVPLSAAELPTESAEEDALWESVGAVSWLVVPLRGAGRVIGALTFLSTDPERVYDERDFPAAVELADRCGQAMLNAQLYEEARSARALLDTVFAAAPVGMSLLDRDLRFVLVNERMAAISGAGTIDDHVGHRLGEVLTGQAHETEAVVRRVVETGEPVTDHETVTRGRAFLSSHAPVTVDGTVLGVVSAVIETTERHRAQERAARLQALAALLASALTEDEVVSAFVQAAMGAAGASCGVLGLTQPDRSLRIAHRFGVAGEGPPGRLALDDGAPMPAAARCAAPVLLQSRAEWLERYPDFAPAAAFEAFAAIPLVYENGVTGVMGLGFPDARGFDADDVEMLLAMGRQGASALERARLYEERAYVARTLQQGLLPRALPHIEGLGLAVLYRPIGDGASVGGDFYDVVALEDGAWLAAVGDIAGKGTAAAVLTGVMRSTIRALALREQRPAELLRCVNEALLREESPQALATLACAALRREGDGFAVTLAAGGHPPPLLLRRDGQVEAVRVRGPMLGADAASRIEETVIRLDPGDTLVLYTDGIIDARRGGKPPFGEDRLREALASAAGRDPGGVIETIDAAVRAYAPGPPRDDKALLVLRAAP